MGSAQIFYDFKFYICDFDSGTVTVPHPTGSLQQGRYGKLLFVFTSWPAILTSRFRDASRALRCHETAATSSCTSSRLTWTCERQHNPGPYQTLRGATSKGGELADTQECHFPKNLKASEWSKFLVWSLSKSHLISTTWASRRVAFLAPHCWLCCCASTVTSSLRH